MKLSDLTITFEYRDEKGETKKHVRNFDANMNYLTGGSALGRALFECFMGLSKVGVDCGLNRNDISDFSDRARSGEKYMW